MKVLVAGLGYVGSVSAACYAYFGHEVVGVDVSAEKVATFARGVPPVREPRLDELVAAGLRARLISATTDLRAALRGTDVVLVCVGTPSDAGGALDLSHVSAVVREIGEAVAGGAVERGHQLAVVVRSTMLPGSSKEVVQPSLAFGAASALDQVGYGVMPEFLREGSAVSDFFEPSKTVIGSTTGWLSERLLELNRPLPGPKFVLGIGEAEMTKYLDNAYHALKVAFANEAHRIAEVRGLDSNQLFQPFLSDSKLNISTRYLNPGAPFGGSCLPKDVRALVSLARQLRVEAPLFEAVLATNHAHLTSTIERVRSMAGDRVVLLGLSFKSHTDDLRESPFVEIARTLAGEGRDVVCFDATIARTKLFGVNRTIFDSLSPLVDWRAEIPTLAEGDAIVLCTDHPEHVAALRELPLGYPSIVDLTGKHVWGRGTARIAS